MPKKDIHPKYYPNAKVFCNGEHVMTVGSTKPEMHIDVWSGNHPFFTGEQRIVDSAGQVDRFMRRLQASQAQQAAAAARKETKDNKPRKKSLVQEIFGDEE